MHDVFLAAAAFCLTALGAWAAIGFTHMVLKVYAYLTRQ